MRIVLAGPDPETSGMSAYTLENLTGICEQRFGKRMHPWSLAAAETSRLLAAEDEAEPPDERPGRRSGL